MADEKHDILIRILADLGELKAQLAGMEKAVGTSAGKAADGFRSIGKSVKDSETELRGIGALLKGVFTDFDTLAGKIMLRYEAVRRVLGTVQAAMQSSLDTDLQRREIQTLINVTEQEFTRISQRLDELALRVRKPTGDINRAFYEVLSSSRQMSENPIQALALLETSARAAVGGLTETATSVKIITDILAAYNLEADQAGYVSDLLFKTVADGKTRFEELAQHLGPLLPIANSLGISLEELTGAVAALTLQGFRTPVAVTALSSFLRSLATVSEEGRKRAQALGIEWDTTVVKSKGLVGAFQILSDKVGDNAEVMKELVSDTEGWQAALALSGTGLQTLKDEVSAMSEVAGVADTAFEKMSGAGKNSAATLSTSFGIIWRAWTDNALPVLNGLADFTANHLPAISAGLKVLGVLLVSVGTGWAAFNLASLSAAGVFFRLGSLVGALTVKVIALNAAIYANPFTVLATVIAAATTAIILFGKSNEDAKESTDAHTKSLEAEADALRTVADEQERVALGEAGGRYLEQRRKFREEVDAHRNALKGLTLAQAEQRLSQLDALSARGEEVSKVLAQAQALREYIAALEAAKNAGKPAGSASGQGEEQVKAEAARRNMLAELLMSIDAKRFDREARILKETEDLKKRARERELDQNVAHTEALIRADMAAWESRQQILKDRAQRTLEMVQQISQGAGEALAEVWTTGDGKDAFRQWLKQILLMSLDALHAELAVAKAWLTIKSLLNWAESPANAAKFLATEALFAMARGMVMRFEHGGPGDFGGFQGLVTRPVLIRAGRMAKMVGEREAEFVAPQKQFRQWANEQLAPLLRGAKAGLSDEDRELLRGVNQRLDRLGNRLPRAIGRELALAGRFRL